MAGTPSEFTRTFVMVAIVALVLLLGLASFNTSLGVLGLILYVAVIVMVVYYRSINRKE